MSVDSGLEIGTHQLHTYFSSLGKRIGKEKVKKKLMGQDKYNLISDGNQRRGEKGVMQK